MASDFFLKLGEIKGESGDHKYKEWIDVNSWSWGATQQASSHTGGGGGAGKVQMQDFHFSSFLNTATADLIYHISAGKHIPKATLICRKAGDKPLEFLKISFDDVLISSYQTGGSEGGDARPMESYTLNFAKVKIEYFQQQKDGSGKAAGVAAWDVKANQKW